MAAVLKIVKSPRNENEIVMKFGTQPQYSVQAQNEDV